MPVKGRILIADDEPTFRQATADLLRREGYECSTVNDAMSAAATLHTERFDLLIADIKMPGNPQLELVQHMPQIDEGLPVILVTGYSSPQTKAMALELPVLAYLTKPLELADLLAAVGRAMEYGALCRAARGLREHLQEWTADHRAAHTLISKPTPQAAIGPEALVQLHLRNILKCLALLQQMSRNLQRAGLDGRHEIVQQTLATTLKTIEAAQDALGDS